MNVLQSVQKFLEDAGQKVVSIFQREDAAVVVRTEHVLHTVESIGAALDKAVETSPAGETIAAFVARVKATL